MKCAYFAFDRLALNTKNKLSESYTHIDYYLMNDEDSISADSIDELDVFVSHLNIPQLKELQTEAHEKYFKSNLNILSTYKSNVYVTKSGKQSSTTEISNIDKSQPSTMNVQLIDDVLYIKWDRNLNKYCVENKQRQLVEYDFLIVENNQFLMSSIIDKQENLFFSFTEQTQFYLNIEFKPEWKHESLQINKTFLLIANQELNSIVDNCYIIKISNDKLNCLIQVPLASIKNDEFLEFTRKRVETVLMRKLVVLKNIEFVKFQTRPTDGFYKFKAQLRNSRFGALVPGYFLWDGNLRDLHLASVMKSRGALKLGSDNKWKRSEI